MSGSHLYELTDEFRTLMAEIEAAEGEVEENQLDRIEELGLEVEIKAENIAMYCAELQATADSCKAEKQRLAAREQATNNRIARLKEYMKMNLEALGMSKVKGDIFTVSVQQGREQAAITDEGRVPKRFHKVSVSINKTELKKALKSGETIPGAELTRGNSFIIIR